MTFIEGGAENSARLHPAGASGRAVMGSGSVARFAAPGSVTDGRFGLFQYTMPPHAGGPDPHYHKTFSESFYILAGTVQLFDGERWLDASAGDFLHVPERGVHAFRNDGAVPADMLILFAPAPPREVFFTELAQIVATQRRLSEEEWIEFYARHDQYRA